MMLKALERWLCRGVPCRSPHQGSPKELLPHSRCRKWCFQSQSTRSRNQRRHRLSRGGDHIVVARSHLHASLAFSPPSNAGPPRHRSCECPPALQLALHLLGTAEGHCSVGAAPNTSGKPARATINRPRNPQAGRFHRPWASSATALPSDAAAVGGAWVWTRPAGGPSCGPLSLRRRVAAAQGRCC